MLLLQKVVTVCSNANHCRKLYENYNYNLVTVEKRDAFLDAKRGSRIFPIEVKMKLENFIAMLSVQPRALNLKHHLEKKKQKWKPCNAFTMYTKAWKRHFSATVCNIPARNSINNDVVNIMSPSHNKARLGIQWHKNIKAACHDGLSAGYFKTEYVKLKACKHDHRLDTEYFLFCP